jgi:hypothetical protein
MSLVHVEIGILEGIYVAWEDHARECEQVPKAILLNQGNYELIGWNEVLGLPVLPDERLDPMRFRLLCGTGRGGHCAEGDVVWDDDGNPYVVDATLDAA